MVQDYFGDQLFFDCTCVNGSDPDGEDDISDRCQFRINEISTQASPTTDGCHIPADQVLRNSNLACTLVPADTDSDGDPIDSPTVAVTNRMPGPPVVSLSPPSGSVADTFTCQILQPSVDPDGDAVVYSYRWWVGGFSDPRFSESSVVAGLLASDLNDTPVAAGDTIACEAIPNDPYGPGQSALSTTVTLGEAACVTAADCFFGHPCLIGSCNGGTCSYQGPAAGRPSLADVFGSAFRSMRLDAPLLGDSFDVTGQGVLELGPFGPVAVAGHVTKQAGGPITWCFDSKTTVDVQLALLKFENAKVTMCRDEQGAYEGTFAGDMILETSRIPVTGTFSAGASWEFGVTATDVDFLGIPFQSLSFSAGETDRQLTITGQFALGDATHGPQLAITGNFTPGQNLRLDVGLAPGFTWYPLPSYPQLSFADIDGELTRVAGVVELHVKREWAGTLDLADGFSGTGLWAEGRLSSTEPWTVSLGATTMVAPLTDPVTISGDFVEDSQFPGTGLLCLSGDGSVPTTPSTPPTATVCLHLGGPDDPTAESVSFSTDLTAPLPQPDGGKYTLNGRYDDRTDLLTLTSDMGWQPTAEFISTLKVGVTIDFTSDPPTLSEVGYSAQIDIAPFPPQVLTGSYDADKEQLCLFDTIQSVPGLDTSLTVEACLNTPDSGPAVLDSITFGSMVNIPLVGPTSLGGSYAVGKLCLGPATNFNGFASWSLPGFAGDSLAVQVCYNENTKAFDAVVFNGTFGTDFMKEPIPVTGGALEKNSAIWICLSGLPTFADSAGAFAGSINNVTVCLAENDGSVTVAEVSFGGAISTPQVGNLTLSGDYANDELCLTSNVDTNAHNWFAGFESLTTVDRFYVRSCLDVVSKTFEDLATVIVFTVGADPTAADAVTVQAQAATDFSGDITLTVSQVPAGSCPADRVCAQNWRPFSAIGGSFANLEFSNFGGSIVRTAAGTTTVDVHGELSAGGEGSSLTIFPGFTLDDVQAEAFFGSGDVGIKLRGSYGFDVGEEHLNVTVRAEVAESGVMSFSGSVAPEDPEHGFQPLKSLVGEDNFSLGTIDVTLAANLDQETVALTFTSQNPFVRVVLPTCSPEVSRSCPELKLASLDGGVAELNGEPGAYFIMTLDAIDIPLVPPSESKPGLTLALGNMPGEVVAIGLSSLSGLTVPAWPGKDPLSQGISFFAKGECPFALGSDGSKPSGSFGVDVDVQSKQLKVDAEIDFDWEIIRPEYNMPGVSSLATTSLNFIATISDVSQFAFGGKVSLVPDNPFDPALSNASLSGDLFLLVDTEGNFGGEIGLEGLWKEPFFMPDFAVMNPALQLKLHLTPAAGVPVPSGVGINGDFFWLKPANSWPNVCEGDQPGDGSCISTTVPNANVPEQLLHAGGTFYFDSAVIPSGFLSVPMPQFIVRLDVDGFDGVGDFVGIANSIKHGVRNYLDWTAEHIPDTGPIPEILPAGIGVVNSDFKLRAGVSLNVQMLGVNQTALGEVSLGQGKAQGEFYVVENAGGLPIFDLGSLGTLILGGDGPNARRGDFDDGLYGEIDLPSGGVNASATLVWRDGSGKDLLIGDAQFENLCTQETCNNMAEYTTNIGGTIDDLPLPLLGGSSIQDASVDFRSDNKVCICHDQDSSNDCTLDGGGSGCNTGNNIGYPDDGSCPPAQLECINTDVRFEATSGKITVGGTSYPTSTDLTITKEQLAWDSTLDLLDLGDLVTALSIKWADVPDRFCGHAQYDFPGGDGWPAFTTSFDGCAGDADIVHALEAGMKSGGFCVNDDFCATTQTCSLGLCVDQFADGSPCLRPRNCKNGGCDGFCYTPHTKGIGEACLNDDECASDACFGVCSCSTDPDTCPAGERCVGTGSAALCVPKAHGLVCGSVSECPNTTDYLCYVGDFGDTQCLWHHDSSWNTLLAGEACYADRECASNNCVGKTAETPGLCNCTSAGGCPAGRACIGVVGQVATCLPTTEGTKCNNNQDCSGGRACVANPEAGGAKQCLTQGVSRKAGQACVTDSQCVSKQCVGTKYVGVQQAPGLCDCDGNAACSTGWCFVAASGIPGVCFASHCDSDADCPSSDYCFAGGCYKKAGSGAICTSNHVCRSDHCDADCVTILGKKICGYTCK